MLTLARRWKVSRFVYISSIGVIGRPTDPPIREDHPTRPLTAYHASKLFGEGLVHVAAVAGMNSTSLRLTSPVGRGMPSNRIFSVFVERAFAGQPLEVAGQGIRRQDYVDVDDVATAVGLCLRRAATGVFNLGAGASVSNAKLARACVEALGSSSSVELGQGEDSEEGDRWEVSIERAQAELGYQPQVKLAASIRAVASESANSRNR
jgi:UDP-glucose 4-epimerase